MSKALMILVLVLVIVVISAFGHFLLLAGVGLGCFLLGSGVGRAQARLEYRKGHRRLGV